MGTQQLLLIVLGVIIVGVAIAVGITIFNNQAINANANALASETNNYAAQVIQYWKTPVAQGGAGRVIGTMTGANIGAFMGKGAATFTTDNGSYTIGDGASGTVTITAVGNEGQDGSRPKFVAVITLDSGNIAGTLTHDGTLSGGTGA